MFTDKYISLEEAKDPKTLKLFIKQHPSKGDEKQFDEMLGRMVSAEKKPKKKQDILFLL